MWLDSIAAINTYLADKIDRGQKRRLDWELWYGHADMKTGKRAAKAYGALDAFFPAVLALSGDYDRASRLQQSSMKMWELHGVEPEEINYETLAVTHPGYPLRPEIVESTYYLYHYASRGSRAPLTMGSRTSLKLGSRASRLPSIDASQQRQPNPREADLYLQMGEQLFRDFVKHCRTDEGYAALKNVVTKEKSDSMQSFLFAETFKYFYLLFAPPRTLDFERVIFNTEAHPVRRMWK
jgi:mannosidase alpha-like ER degradation enhancer 2